MSNAADADDEYAGVLTVQNGRLHLPPEFVAANRFVVRQRTITQNIVSGRTIDTVGWRDNHDCEYGEQNPDLAPDEVRLKLYGEPAELYRVDVDEGGEPDE